MGAGTRAFDDLPSNAISKATNFFRDAISEKADNNTVRNVFISFHMDDEMQVKLLRIQAREEKFNIEFRDYSVKEPFDEKWKKNVSERISQTSATLVMIGPNTASRPAVKYEIEESYIQGKKVIGVRIFRNRSHPIPDEMLRKKAPILNWDLGEIQRELNKE